MALTRAYHEQLHQLHCRLVLITDSLNVLKKTLREAPLAHNK